MRYRALDETAQWYSGPRCRGIVCAIRVGALDEAQFVQNRNDLGRFQNRNVAHALRNGNILDPDKFRFEVGLAIFKKHDNYFTKV